MIEMEKAGTTARCPALTDHHITGQIAILGQYVFYTLRQVKVLLHFWEEEALQCVNPELKIQALASLQKKGFHCHGGAVLAVPYGNNETLLRLIVAYQTLCDYLDNLCDRANCTDGRAFRRLHESLLDGLEPNKICVDYYQYFAFQEDGGYIEKLVQECRCCINRLPSYQEVQAELTKLAGLYIDLQVYKHLPTEVRETTLIQWAEEKAKDYPCLYWQEFAASTGSTLAVFALFGLASQSGVKKESVTDTVNALFPWICGLHILLDYFIDQQEDREGNDLNFTFYYAGDKEMLERLKWFVQQSQVMSGNSPNPVFFKTIVDGLLAMYLSDQKIRSQGYEKIARDLLALSGRSTQWTYWLCKMARKRFAIR